MRVKELKALLEAMPEEAIIVHCPEYSFFEVRDCILEEADRDYYGRYKFRGGLKDLMPNEIESKRLTVRFV